MGRNEKKAYVKATRARYLKADRAKKGRILEEFCETCNYHRKYAIRLLNKKPKRRAAKRRIGRPQYDKAALLEALKVVWQEADYMCSKKLKAALPMWLPYYEEQYGYLSETQSLQLCVLSPATIDRWLSPYKAEDRRAILSGALLTLTFIPLGQKTVPFGIKAA